MTDDANTRPPAAPDRGSRAGAARTWSWNKLLRWSAIAGFVVIAAISIFGGAIIPPLIVFAVLWLVGALLLSRSSKAAAILLLITFLLFLGLSAPFVVPTLAVPASAGDFILNAASLIAAIVGIVAAIGVLRRRDAPASSTPRMVGMAGLGIFLLTFVVGIVALVTYKDASAQAGDIKLVAEDFEFSADTLRATQGEVSVFVENKDSTLHTFTVDELGVDLDVPAGSSARVTFDAEPGTYEFYCVPHKSDMNGDIEVGD
jgi:plastocyanin